MHATPAAILTNPPRNELEPRLIECIAAEFASGLFTVALATIKNALASGSTFAWAIHVARRNVCNAVGRQL